MNFFCDANVSPHLAHALDALSQPEGHPVKHLTDKFPAATPDIDWVNSLAREGRWAVLTQDRAMARRPIEQEVLRRSGLIVFMLARAWNSQNALEQGRSFGALVASSDRSSFPCARRSCF